MNFPKLAIGLAAAACCATAAAQSSDSEGDALGLVSAPDAPAAATPAPFKLMLEAAAGVADRRSTGGTAGVRRLSVDLYRAGRLAPGWRYVVSDRIDHVRPADGGLPDTVNSLREAYVGWDAGDGASSLEFGRINLRQGTGYGYNPTDFFRDGSLRTVTSLNPFSQRENRLGVVMLRGQRTWAGGSVALAFAPKLADSRSSDGASLDLGATNNRDRWLLSASRQISERVNAQALLYKETGQGVQLGASATALIGTATVAHAEWAHGRQSSLADMAGGSSGGEKAGHRYAFGLTYTTAGKLSVTGELQGNDFALADAGWAAAGGAAQRGAYLLTAEQRQDLASRRAALVYLTQKDLLGVRNLLLSAFVRFNTIDHSRLHWAELRYQWPSIDMAVQWQRSSGGALDQWGLMPDRQVVQAVATYHFR